MTPVIQGATTTSVALRHVHVFICVVCQFTREAHFTGDGYLGLKMNSLPIPDDFYAGIGFRTDQQTGLMFYGQSQVHITVRHIKYTYIEYITYNANFMSNSVFVFVPSE